jgi:hypothetical protein
MEDGDVGRVTALGARGVVCGADSCGAGAEGREDAYVAHPFGVAMTVRDVFGVK